MRNETGVQGMALPHPYWFVFVCALAIRGVYLLIATPDPFVLDAAEYDTGARALLDGRGLVETGNGGIRPPLYLLFVAASYAIGGLAALQLTQVLVSAMTAVSVALLASQIHGSRAAGTTAGLAAAVYPWFIFYVGSLAPETLFAFLVTAALVLLMRASRTPTAATTLAAGVVLGLAALTRSNLVLLMPFLLLWAWSWLRSLWSPTLVAAATAFTIAPAALYLAAAGYGLTAGGTGGGLAFYIGNGPDQTALQSGRLSDDDWRDLNLREIGPAGLEFAQCAALPCVPLVDRDEYFYAASFRYIREHTAEWAATSAKKAVRAWQPWVEPRAYPAWIVVVSGISFAGLLGLAVSRMRQLPPRSVGLLAAAAGGTTLTAVLFLASHRYRFPILDPVLIAVASGTATDLVRSAIQRSSGSVAARSTATESTVK